MFINFFSENRTEIMSKKSGGARQATEENITRRMRFACWTNGTTRAHIRTTLTLPGAHAHMHTQACTRATRAGICNNHCFSTAKMVSRTRLNFTLYVHCLSCFHIVSSIDSIISVSTHFFTYRVEH